MQDKWTNETISLEAAAATINVGGRGQNGGIRLFPQGATDTTSGGSATAHLSAGTGVLPGQGAFGALTLSTAVGDAVVSLSSQDASMRVGGNGLNASLQLFGSGSKAQDTTDPKKSRIRLQADLASVVVGGNGQGGDLQLFDSGSKAEDTTDASKSRIRLQAGVARVVAGGNGVDGDLRIFPASVEGSDTDDVSKATIHFDGNAGNITLNGDILLAGGAADCAEDFDLMEAVEPGTVMVIDEEGALRQSREPYDRRVAGVIAGGGNYRSGLVLDRRRTEDRRSPLALLGKVFCKVDAQYAPIRVGDLLTTSLTPGHAMRAEDPLKAFGTVIGKSLRPLAEGQALIPILVALQ